MIKTGKFWHSPLNVYWHIQELTKEVGPEAIESDIKYQQAREARSGAILALAMFKMLGSPMYLQLYKPDPPDLILMHPSAGVRGRLNIFPVEITTFSGASSETLLEQLKRTKIKPGIHALSKEDLLLVNLGVGLDVDYEPIRDYLNENKTPFAVWTIQEISKHPDTIARVVSINPELREIVVNVGEAADSLGKLKIGDVLRTSRVGSEKRVRWEEVEKIYYAPWETVSM